MNEELCLVLLLLSLLALLRRLDSLQSTQEAMAQMTHRPELSAVSGIMGAEQSSTKHTRRREYRSGKRGREEGEEPLERALDLLENNDFTHIAHTPFPQVRGPVSWARVAVFACNKLKIDLAGLRSEGDLRNAASHATVLLSRLEARDAVKGARTTRELRDTILQLASLTNTLTEVRRIFAGALAPNFENASRASTIRQLWVRLNIKDNPWVKEQMEHTVATVLASNATAGIKAAFTRLLLAWQPPPKSTEGTKVQWDSDDDF